MNKLKKALSILLCLSMLVQYVPVAAFAAEADGLCAHHTAHTADCGYAAAVAGVPCAHDHDTAVCGYVEALQEVLCQCTATDESGALVHTEGCGYVAPVAGSDCTHIHDEACGYVAAVEGHECHYECAECAEAETTEQTETETEAETTEAAPICDCGTDDASVHATSCPAYVAPENPACTCAEKCVEANVWCDVCGFDVTACEGEDTAAAYDTCSHSGGTATCTALAVCDLCGQSYGDYGHTPNSYIGQTCGGYLCTICGQLYGEANPDNHVGIPSQCPCGKIQAIKINDVTVTAWEQVSLDGGLAAYTSQGEEESVSTVFSASSIWDGKLVGTADAPVQIGVFIKEGSSKYNWENVRFTHKGSAWTSNYVYWEGADSTQKISAYYPFGDADDYYVGYFTVTADGTTDWLYALPTALTSANVSLNMSHALSRIVLDLTLGSEASGETIEKIEVGGMYASGKWTFAENTWSELSGTTTLEMTVNSEGDYELLVIPMDSCTSIPVTVTMTNGKVYAAQITALSALESGKEYKIDLQVGCHAYTYADNGDGTHTGTCSVCGATTTESCSGGTATCTTQAVCDLCGTSYGNVDSDAHTPDESIGQSCMGYQCAICQSWFGIGNGDNHVKIGECECGLTAYPIWVSGVQVTNDNKDDVIPNVAGGITGFYAKYDPDTNILTLNGKFDALKVIGDINLNLAGAVAIYGSVDVSGTMVTSGTGTLTLDSTLYPSASAIPSSIIGTGTVIIDGNSFIYDNTNEKWVCADESQHTGDATCKVQAECTLCGVSYIDSDLHTADTTIGQTCKGYWCTTCESWYGELADHTFENDTCTVCGAVSYGIWLGDTVVNSANADDVLGDGTASYDPATNTLTLTNATVDTTALKIPALDIRAGDVKLVISGTNTLTANEGGAPYQTEDGSWYGYAAIEIAAGASLTISGGDEDTLTLSGNAYGISAVDTISYLAAISGDGDLTVSGGNITALEFGIAPGGSYTQSGGTVTAGFIGAENVTVSGGTLTATGHCGIEYANANANTHAGGIHGIWAKEKICISGGTVTTAGGELASSDAFESALVAGTTGSEVYPDGLCAGESVTVTGGTVTSTGSAGGYCFGTMGDAVPGEEITVTGKAIDAPAYPVSADADFTCGSDTSHSYGEATCAAPATCGFCRGTTGELDADNHAKNTYTYEANADGTSHTKKHECCDAVADAEEGHSFDESGKCVCEKQAVASVTIGETTTYYLSLDESITAVANCTAADKAVVKMEQDVDLGSEFLQTLSGVFTFDLNGKTLSSSKKQYGALCIDGGNVTITDSGEGGAITNSTCHGVMAWYGCTVTIEGGTITGYYVGVDCMESTVIIDGGTIIGENEYGVQAGGNSTVTIDGGTITGTKYDLYIYDSTVSLGLGEDGVGAAFPDGLDMLDDDGLYNQKPDGLTLKDILGEGAAYWQGDKMLTNVTGTSIDGDVTVKAECKHENTTYPEDGITDTQHKVVCSCGYEATEAHSTEKDENKATCQQGDICDLCGEEYGEKDSNNHTTTETNFKSDPDYTNRHCEFYKCCDAFASWVGYHEDANGDSQCDDCEAALAAKADLLPWTSQEVIEGWNYFADLNQAAEKVNEIYGEELILLADGTISEGETLTLTQAKLIPNDFTLTVNGTLVLSSGKYTGATIPSGVIGSGTVTIGENHFTFNGSKWVCAEATQHTGGEATCKTGKLCDLCGVEYSEQDADNHAGTLGNYTPTEDDTQHTATWSCCEATVTEDHDLGYTAQGMVITQGCSECEFALTFNLVIPTGAVYGDSALAVPHYVSSDTTYQGDLPVITIGGEDLKSFTPNAGEYEVIMTWGGQSVNGTYTIAQAEVIDEEPAAKDGLVYNGKAQALVTAGSTYADQTLYYALGIDGDWLTEIPSAAEAGTYTVYWCAGDSNGNYKFTSGKQEIEIAPAQLTVTANDNSITYGDAPENAGVSYEGFVNGETEDVLSGALTYSYDYEQYDDVGAYTITPSGLTSGNYEITFVPGTLTVEKKAITVKADTVSKIYGEADPALTYKVEGLVNSDSVTGALTRAEGENVGTYAIEQGTLTAGDNYTITYTSAELTVTAKAITEADVALDGSLVYTGAEQTQNVTVTDGITYEISDNKATNAGTYELTVTGTGNYTGEVKMSWSIKAAAATVETAPAANELTYTGKTQALVTAGTANGGKLVYSLTENDEYTETIPSGTNADEYTVWYYIQGDDNHADSAKASVKVTVAKAQAEISVDTTTIEVVYGTPVTLPTATSNFGIVSCDKTADELVNAGTYTVTYSVAGTDNYESDSKSLTVIVEKKAVAEPTVTGTYTYTGSEQTVALVGIESYMTVASGNKAVGAGSYEVDITLDGNHKWADGSDGKVQWSIGKAAFGDVCVSQSGTLTYNGTAQTPNVKTDADSVGDQTVTITYRLTENESYGEMPAFTDAGSYTVYFKASAPNHKDADGSFTVTVDKAQAEITVNTDPITATYGETVTLPTATSNFGTVTCDKTAEDLMNAGTYTVTYTVAGTDNYDGDTKTITVTVNKRSVTIAAKDQTIIYGGTISDAEIAADNLLAGHAASATLTPSTAKVTANGTITASAAVITADGTDVTANYAISYATGKLVIQPDTAKIDSLTAENITSANREDIEAVQKMMKDADSVQEEWETISGVCEDLLKKIDEVAAENDRIEDAVDQFELDSVKSSDEETLTQLISDIDDQLATNNLTDEERTKLEGLKTKCENLLAKINGTEDLIDQLDKTVGNLNAETVKSTDRATLEQIIEDAESLIKGGNITEGEKEILEQIQADAEDLIKVIDDTAAEQKDITDEVSSFDQETVKSTDQEELEQLAEEIQTLLDGDNLTEDERKALEEVRDQVQDMLDTIGDTTEDSKTVTDTITALDPATVTSDDQDKVEQAIETIDKLLDADHLTEDERNALEDAKKDAEALLDAIERKRTVAILRLYNPVTGEHFYTGSVEEKDNLVAAGWNYEGVGWNAPVYEGAPIYRLYNPYTGDHHYTGSKEECDDLEMAGWKYEGVAWNTYGETEYPQYRLYNPYAKIGIHHYTGSTEERDHLVSLGWRYEGIAWYGSLK